MINLVGDFDVIVADPPWSYYGSTTKWGAAAKFYPLMSDDEIQALPIPELLAPRGILFLWATSSTLGRAFKLIEAWGLHDRGIAFSWIKTSKAGMPFRARGVRPSITKPLEEFVIAGSRVARGRPMPIASESVCQTIFAPLGRHSEKPEVMQDRIEALYPNTRKLELFARREREGWTTWGDEVGVESLSIPEPVLARDNRACVAQVML